MVVAVKASVALPPLVWLSSVRRVTLAVLVAVVPFHLAVAVLVVVQVLLAISVVSVVTAVVGKAQLQHRAPHRALELLVRLTLAVVAVVAVVRKILHLVMLVATAVQASS